MNATEAPNSIPLWDRGRFAVTQYPRNFTASCRGSGTLETCDFTMRNADSESNVRSYHIYAGRKCGRHPSGAAGGQCPREGCATVLCKDALVATVQAVGMGRNRNSDDEWNTNYAIEGVAGCNGNKVLADGADSTDINAAKVDVCGSKIKISEEAEQVCHPCARAFKISRLGTATANFASMTAASPSDLMPILPDPLVIPPARQLTMGHKTWFQVAAAKKYARKLKSSATKGRAPGEHIVEPRYLQNDNVPFGSGKAEQAEIYLKGPGWLQFTVMDTEAEFDYLYIPSTVKCQLISYGPAEGGSSLPRNRSKCATPLIPTDGDDRYVSGTHGAGSDTL